MLSKFLLCLPALASVLACPGHNEEDIHLAKRADAALKDWSYDASYNWGMVNSNYTLCQTGTQQSPIGLLLTQGLSLSHNPVFTFPASVNGTFSNWGYGPAYTVDHSSGDYTKHPSMKYDNTTVYLKGWHIHSPSEHVVQGERTKAEMHFVFGDAEGHEKAVAGIRIDPGNTASNFVSALPPMIGFANKTTVAWTMDLRKALDEVNNFSDFWTYKGSLTSPPCTEGIRWFVARNVMYISAKQMQALLGASSFSSRVKQDVWLHQINA